MIAPLPEALDGQRWDVQSSSAAAVNLKTRTMFVPLTASDTDHFLRLHEMAHAKWTPAGKEPGKIADKLGIDVQTLQVCEDMRMHLMLCNHGFSPKLVGADTDAAYEGIVQQALPQPNPLRGLAQLAVARFRTGDYMRLIGALERAHGNEQYPEEHRATAQHLKETIGSLIEQTTDMFARCRGMRRTTAVIVNGRKEYHRIGPSFRDTEKVAVFLENLIKAAPPRAPEQAEAQEMKANDRVLKNARLPKSRAEGGIPWGEASLTVLPLPNVIKAAQAARGRKATDFGVVPVNMHRMCVDQRIFSTRRRAPGGTVLIDASGSMSLSLGQIEEIMLAAPCAKVAMYSGNYNRGVVTVIADSGHRASSEAIERARQKAGGGNIIDGPALDWLTKQQEPRIWVCDGLATGVNDRSDKTLISSAFAKARQGNIRRLHNLTRAVEAFKALRRGQSFKADHLKAV